MEFYVIFIIVEYKKVSQSKMGSGNIAVSWHLSQELHKLTISFLIYGNV